MFDAWDELPDDELTELVALADGFGSADAQQSLMLVHEPGNNPYSKWGVISTPFAYLHVRCTPMGRTRRWAAELELTHIGVELNGSRGYPLVRLVPDREKER